MNKKKILDFLVSRPQPLKHHSVHFYTLLLKNWIYSELYNSIFFILSLYLLKTINKKRNIEIKVILWDKE